MSTDLWLWRAEFSDDSVFDEFDERGQHGFAEIDQSRLTRFILIPQYDGLPTHVVLAPGDGELIFFRRRQKEIDPNTDESSDPITVAHCLGIQHDEKTIYTFLFADNSVVVTDDLNAI